MISYPSNIIPNFEKESESQITVREVFGDLTVTNLMNKGLEKIRAGQYTLRRDVARELGVKTEGTFANAEWAAAVFIFECGQSNEEWTRAARAQIPDLAQRLGLELQQLLDMNISEVWEKLAITPAESPQFRKAGQGSPGRKLGSHRDGTGHR